MAKVRLKPVVERRRVLQVISGTHNDYFYRLTYYSDGQLLIERPWCKLYLSREREVCTDETSNMMPLLEEKATLHKWLIWFIQENNGDRSFWKPATAHQTDPERDGDQNED